MALGYKTKEIARQLGLSIKTIETHRQQLTKRLGIGHVPGLVRYALQTGLVPASWLTG
jgi:DNA-binding CsgD family transcriptional regulator